ncbi:nuclear transport factor 2-like [Glandiceps talaboti]
MNVFAQFKEIGFAFANHYYITFDANRSNLRPLYAPSALLTFENDQFQGPDAIITKLTSLPFQVVKHVTTTVDCQPIDERTVLVFVVGQLKTDDDPPHGFSQVFQLKTDGNTWFIVNDMFRLTLHHQ